MNFDDIVGDIKIFDKEFENYDILTTITRFAKIFNIKFIVMISKIFNDIVNKNVSIIKNDIDVIVFNNNDKLNNDKFFRVCIIFL